MSKSRIQARSRRSRRPSLNANRPRRLANMHRSTHSTRAAMLHYAGAVLFVGGIVYVALYQLTTRAGWAAVANYRALFWRGGLGTIGLAAGALVFSILFGGVLTLGRRARWLPVRALCT